MNQRAYRLVFDRRRGMRVAAAEHVRSTGKAAGGSTRACALAIGAAALLVPPAGVAQQRPPVVFASKLPAPAKPLPQPYGASTGRTDRTFVANPQLAPRVSWNVQGKTGTFDQGNVDRVVLNWDSFDIGAGYKVHFKQNTDPSRYVSALNKIWSADPSVILGSLTADREVILLNANGVYFGRGARVDTGKFVATSLGIADAVFEKGLRNVTDGSAVFSTTGTDYQGTNLNSTVSVEAGAEIRSAAGGDVLLIAPRVVNQGRIETPKGQAVLAAGDKVYLMSSSDPKQRGLIVAVDPVRVDVTVTDPQTGESFVESQIDRELGIVENAATGGYKTVGGDTVADTTPDNTAGLVTRLNEIRAESGSVNLVGLTVRQNGRLSATTAVKGANGAIYLQAMASTRALDGGPDATSESTTRGLLVEAGSRVRVSAELGTVQVGAGSVTEVRPDAGSATQIDAEVFNRSLIRAEGSAITVANGAQMVAPGGTIELLASRSADGNPIFYDGQGGTGQADSSRVVVAPGAILSTAGLQNVEVDGARNQGSQRLFRIELADSPVQRAGPLYRSEVFFDGRDSSKIPIANVTGSAAAVARSANELSAVGGSIRIESDGAVVLGEGATLDVSGGSVRYSQTTLKNSLLSQDGRAVLFRSALPGNTVDAVLGTTQQTVVPAYTEGANGGSLLLNGRQLALGAQINGRVTQGERQRDNRSPRATPSALTIGSRSENLYYVGGIALRGGAAPAIDPAVFQDPLQATLPGLSDTLDLSLGAVADGGFGALALRASRVTQPGFGSIDLGLGGSFNVEAGTVSLDGAFSAPGGRVSIVTPSAPADADLTGEGDIRLSGATRLDASGRWTNDTALAAAGPAAGVQTNGGTVRVASANSLLIEPGAVVDVSAGAWLSGRARLSKGKAGSVSLSTSTSDALRPELDIDGATLKGFDFDSGGTLTLGTPALTLSNGPASGFVLSPEFFSASGFGTITVNAFGDIREQSGTRLAPQLKNWQLADRFRSAASGPMSGAVANPAVIDTRLADRKPVNITLAATRPLQAGGGSVVIERGASIEVEPGGSIRLSATRDVEVGYSGGADPRATSELTARGGSISLGITGARGSESGQDNDGFLNDQAIWLGSGARLSTQGIAQLRPDTSAPVFIQFRGPSETVTPIGERVTGSVLGGGAITLDAKRGYVVAEAGSTMRLDGASAGLNLPGLAGAVQVAKPAGTLTVSSPEGFAMDGSISAVAPSDAAGRTLADGGRLQMSVGAGGVYTTTLNPDRPYQTTARTIAVGEFDGLIQQRGAVRGEDLTQSLDNGTGYVRTAVLRDAGFDAVALGAGDLLRFDTNVSLNKPLGIELSAPAISALPGVQVSLSANVARIGDASFGRIGAAPDTTAVPDASTAQNTRLSVVAPTIEVLGSAGLQGFSQVLLDAGASPLGEIRFTVASPSFGRVESLAGQLSFSGQLGLTAGQVYSTSATQYTLNGLAAGGSEDPGSRLVVRTASGGAAPRQPLSAFGSLTVNATDIDQGGVLRQPFGSITLNAERTLSLGDRSITSVSGQGVAVPYGQTINLAEWSLPGGQSFDRLPVPKGVTLTGDRITTSGTALVSAGGGGVVQASEFFPGVGGSRDYFETAGLYAVLPDYSATQALSVNGGQLDAAQQGRQIVITTPGSGLAPGRYTLLPARYALLGGQLPRGAYLVSRASDQGTTTLRAPVFQADGSVVVAGYITNTGSANVGAPGERFVVEPQGTFLSKSEIRLTDISDLLASRAEALGKSRPALPRDGGQVGVGVRGTETSLWQARLDLAAGGAQAGLLDMAATRLALVDDLEKTPEGALGVSSDVIASSGAGSVLLGGRRSLESTTGSNATPAWKIDQTGTGSVNVDLGDTPLQVEELLLASSGNVTLAQGTQIRATERGTLGARTLTSAGDGAVIAVSANRIELQRTGASLAGGDLSIGAGSTLSGAQVGLDATGALSVDSSTALRADAVSLGARRVMVGEGSSADPTATVLSGALLATVRSAPDLTLRGYSSVDFVGEQNWSGRPAATIGQPSPAAQVVQERLVLDAPSIRGLAASNGAAARTDIAAQEIVIRNTSGGVADTSLVGQGSLELQALPPLRYGRTGGLAIGPGPTALGFDSSNLRSTGDIVLEGSGGALAQQDLTLSAARVTATTGADQSIAAAGNLNVVFEPGSRTLGERVGQGAKVNLEATTVLQSGRIDLPGGVLAIEASGASPSEAAISFGVGSSTSVAGFALPGRDGFAAYGAAGAIIASAGQGRIEALGTLDVSAASGVEGGPGKGNAGSLTLQASGAGGQLILADSQAGGTLALGRLLGMKGSSDGDLGGRLRVDVTEMSRADDLARAAGAGGMTSEFDLRVRGGGVNLDEGITARRIAVSADAGSLVVGDGPGAALLLDATAPGGGVVQLAAGGDLVVGNGTTIDARSQRGGANGGDVLLASASGTVRVDTSAVVEAGGDGPDDGRIVLRAQRGAGNASVNVAALNTSNLRAGEVDIEAVQTYSTVTVSGVTREIASIATGASSISGVSGTLGQSSVRADNDAFMTSAATTLASLGVGDDEAGRVHLRAGVEVRASGDLTVGSDWALNAERPGGDAGFLTLRAAGNLAINGSLSDGFSSVLSTGVLNDNARSWSYRLAGGADLTAADPLRVIDQSQSENDTGNLSVAAGRMVRTGAGSIEMAAGNDIRFAAGAGSTAPGLAYVAGRKLDGSDALLAGVFAGQAVKPGFTEQGGRLELSAARDIISPEATQLINNWFWRSGLLSTRAGEEGLYNAASQLGWWSQFNRFRQTLGSFGGGDVTVEAGRDIVNVQAMAPTAGWADSRQAASAALQVIGGGDVTIHAGRDVLGGQFLVGRGEGRLQANGSIGEAPSNVNLRAPVLGLMDGDWTLSARDDLVVGGAFNPTAAPASSADNRGGLSGFFYTWNADAALRLVANTGNVSLLVGPSTESQSRALGLDISTPSAQSYFQVLPATLTASAATGSIDLLPPGSQVGAVLFPSRTAQLELWAGDDIRLGGAQRGGVLAMADSDPTLWPDASRPIARGVLSPLTNSLIPNTLSDELARTGLHAADTEPVRIHAEGSLEILGASADRATLLLPKPARIYAGEDAVELSVKIQNLRSDDRSSIEVGRNYLAGQFGGVVVSGPGSLEISAGRSIDLGASSGVRTDGNDRNASLPAQGASVRLAAARSGVLDVAAFEASYLRPANQGGSLRSQQYRDALLTYVRQTLKQPSLNYDEAWALFQTFPKEGQASFGRNVLAQEFGAVYLTDTTPTSAQMTESLRVAFERRKADVLQAGETALAQGTTLTLPGREILAGAALAAYLSELRGLAFTSLDLDATVSARVASLARVSSGWRDTVAASLGGTPGGFDALAAQNPQDPAVLAYRAALGSFTGPVFETYRGLALAAETASAGSAASQFGRRSLPMRLALFDQGFQVAELAGVGSFTAQPVWPGSAPVLAYSGTMNVTQSSVITERGGDISLVNPGGAINVGLKDTAGTGASAAKGVIALGGGDVFGFARDDFQVNTQRVFVVGQGDMNIWSSGGDIDSGRGANTAVAVPPLAARRTVDGVVFEVPATTTGSGLGILEDAEGLRSGTIGLYPAFGEILALDAFIRAPKVVLGSNVKGADNIQSPAVSGAGAPTVSAPVVSTPPPNTTQSAATSGDTSGAGQQESRQRNGLLTVELLGLGSESAADDECSLAEEERKNARRKDGTSCTR